MQLRLSTKLFPKKKNGKKSKVKVKSYLSADKVIKKLPFQRKKKMPFSFQAIFISLALHSLIVLFVINFLYEKFIKIEVNSKVKMIQTDYVEPVQITFFEKENEPVVKEVQTPIKHEVVKNELAYEEIFIEDKANVEPPSIKEDTVSLKPVENEIVEKSPTKENEIIKDKPIEKKVAKKKPTLEPEIIPNEKKKYTPKEPITPTSMTPSRIDDNPFIYPRMAKRLGHSGNVEIKVWINHLGAVDRHLILSSSGSKILDQAAKKAIAKYKFTTTSKGTQTAIQTIEYKLK